MFQFQALQQHSSVMTETTQCPNLSIKQKLLVLTVVVVVSVVVVVGGIVIVVVFGMVEM
jgi:hypothetical protein